MAGFVLLSEHGVALLQQFLVVDQVLEVDFVEL